MSKLARIGQASISRVLGPGIAIALFCTLALGSMAGIPAQVQADGPAQDDAAPSISSKTRGHPRLASALQRVADAGDESLSKASQTAQEQGIKTVNGSVVVVVETAPGRAAQVQARVQTLGGVVQRTQGNRFKVSLPISALRSVEALDGVNFVSQPSWPLASVVSEGVGNTSAGAWHAAGFNGAGVKVAVVDLGFDGYLPLLGTELPSMVTARSFGTPEDITGGGENHGTRVAEIVHDMAPGAQLYLVHVDDEFSLDAAVDWLITENVDVINHSVGWFNQGPGDGTGPVGDIVAKAKSNGILWVNAAGNNARRHWAAQFTDTDGDGFHNYDGTPDEGNTITVAAGVPVIVLLRWDDWPVSSQDYDVYLVRSSTGTIVWGSTDDQTGTQPPTEAFSVLVAAGTYNIQIHRAAASRDVNFDLYIFNQNLQFQTPAGSIAMPADSPNALVVGATHWNTNALEPFSSQGPNEAGLIKPDIAAPDCTTDSFGPEFCGTSGASPHVAGTAALVLQANPAFTPSQVQSYLESRALPMGDPGKDNQFGSGRLNLAEVPLDLAVTNSPSATIPVGDQPNTVRLNPAANRAYVSNQGSNTVSVINTDTNSVVATIPVGASPGGIQFNPATNRIYVVNQVGDSVSVIDSTNNIVITTIPVGDQPGSMAMNPVTNRIYVANVLGDSLSVIDGSTNSVIATIPMGDGPNSVRVDPATNRIYVTVELSDVLAVVDGVTHDFVIITVGDAPDTIELATNGRIYVGNLNSDNVSVVDVTSSIPVLVTTIPVGDRPTALRWDPGFGRLYVANANADTVSVVDGTSNTIITTIPVGDNPRNMTMNPTTNRLYVANRSGGTVSVIDTTSNTVVNTIPVGITPRGFQVDTNTNRVYVPNFGSDTLSVITDLASPGGQLFYTVAAANNGTATATGVQATSTLPAGVTFVSATVTQGSFNSGTGVWDVGSLGAGLTATLNLTASVNPGTPIGTVLTSTATVTGAQLDPNPANNTAVAMTTVAAAPPILEAALALHVHQDPADGAAGLKLRVDGITDSGTGAPVAVLLGQFQAKLTYNGACLNILGFRNLAFAVTAGSIDNAAGVATFNGATLPGIAAPADLGFALTRLVGGATQPCAVTLEVLALNASGGGVIDVPETAGLTLRRGDARSDGAVTIADALFLAQYLAGTRVACTSPVTTLCLHSVNAASVRQDGAFDRKTIADALFIAQFLAGLRDEFFGLAGG